MASSTRSKPKRISEIEKDVKNTSVSPVTVSSSVQKWQITQKVLYQERNRVSNGKIVHRTKTTFPKDERSMESKKYKDISTEYKDMSLNTKTYRLNWFILRSVKGNA